MRRRVNWLVLAVTALVVVAYVLPLSLLVRRQAMERAQIAAEQRAQSAAGALAVAVAAANGTVDRTVAAAALVSDVAFILPDGIRIGVPDPPASLVSEVAEGSTASYTAEDGTWSIGLPIATPAGVVSVVSRATLEEMTAGVGRATLLLVALALALVVGSVLLADRLGRSLVRPVTALAETAHRLGEGDLTVRAQVDGPPEVKAVAQALNGLASRLDDIIEGERQALADLSHRLRTPLTALRLEAERLSTGTASERLLQQVDRTERAVDQLIREVGNRDRTEGRRGRTDLVDVVRRRLDFWSVLAEDQNRTVTAHLHHDPLIVPASESELAAVVDALIENIFTHTPPGTGFEVTVREEAAAPLLVVSDAGPGFGSGDPVERGRSGAGSTGLGLDIARSLAERLGGGIETHEGPGGGALVMVRLG